MEDYWQRFGGISRLYGREGLEKLRRSHVCVIGIGGVGSWAAEALARTGVGALTMVDLDDVCITNVNRQLPALDGTIGLPKVHVMSERIRAIAPECAVTGIHEFITESNAITLLAPHFSVVLDCVDLAAIKAVMIAECGRQKIRIVTVGGAGGRRDPTRIRVGDLNRCSGDRLLKQVKKKLRSNHGFSRDPKKKYRVPCVWSEEPQVFPWADGTCRSSAEPDGNLKMDCASGYGSATFITGAFAFAGVAEAVRLITNAPTAATEMP